MKRELILIDDSKIDLMVNMRVLQMSGLDCSIRTFTGGEEALEYLKNLPDDFFPFCILLDIMMPDMSGFDFLDLYIEMEHPLKDDCDLFMLSTTLDPNEILKAEQSPYVKKLLSKPLDTDYLKILLR